MTTKVRVNPGVAPFKLRVITQDQIVVVLVTYQSFEVTVLEIPRVLFFLLYSFEFAFYFFCNKAVVNVSSIDSLNGKLRIGTRTLRLNFVFLLLRPLADFPLLLLNLLVEFPHLFS